MKLSLIAIFAYNRLDHIIRLVDSLKNNYLYKKSEILIFSDGHKNIENINKIQLVRSCLKKILKRYYNYFFIVNFF